MRISERQEQILNLLKDNGFMTVDKLSKLTYTSPSSIRRDLTHLQNMNLLKRTHGGVTILENTNQAIPLYNRLTKNTTGKRKIAKIASALLADSQVIMLDGSTTASFLIPYIAQFKDVTLFTNNMITAISAIEYGIHTHCIGGSSINNSAVLAGEEAYRTVSSLTPDLLFFSSQSLDRNGVISDPTQEENYLRSIMLENSRKSIFLCDHEKFDSRSLYTLTTVAKVNYSVFDKEWEVLNGKYKSISAK